jgi:predicted Zn-dependent protease
MKTVHLLFLVLVFALFHWGCASSSKKMDLTAGEVKLERETYLANQLSQKAEKHFDLKKNTEVELYLSRLTDRLITAAHLNEEPKTRIFLIDDKNSLWRSFAIPGNRFYISVGLLKTVEYEHELAALLSLQVALLSRNVMLNLINSVDVSLGSPSPQHLTWEKLFNASLQEELASLGPAIEILYQAGFDPRGMISLYDRHSLSPDHSPYSQKTLELYIQTMKQEISKLPPLRNPIVRSEEFIFMKQRINKL